MYTRLPYFVGMLVSGHAGLVPSTVDSPGLMHAKKPRRTRIAQLGPQDSCGVVDIYKYIDICIHT